MIIGIDPGVNGGIAIIHDDKEKEDFFVLQPIPKVKNVVDTWELNDFLSSFPSDTHVFVENVHAIFGSSAKSTFNFGFIFGIIQGIVIANKYPMTLIQPKEWQKEMFRGIPEIQRKSSTGKTMIRDTKAMAAIAAKRLFPGVDLYITEKGNKSNKVHDGLCDALLIAGYGKLIYNRGL